MIERSALVGRDVQARRPSTQLSFSCVEVTGVEKVVRVRANGAEESFRGYGERRDLLLAWLPNAEPFELRGATFSRQRTPAPWRRRWPPSSHAIPSASVLPVSLWLARHGETAENAEGRILGRRDPPLSPVGVAQADALAGRLRDVGIVAVWTSPLRRARETAEVVARVLGVETVVLGELVESDRGDWEGLRVAELADESPDLHAAFIAGVPSFRFPGGESLAEQRARTRSALAAVRAGPLPALVVAHAGTIRAVLADSGASVPAESALPHGAVLELPV